ncbi:MAG: hypothetical protein JRJ42_06150 [Deltaproteobacteria bacterium]|nr:hypothetical protein [Deltaproteobacteria bacterium]MBW2019648.1 hypothetical protein [Deltaproteobacteria bacterium]MBW2074164.1 hypothetical protein [Deltaproteobacteria bacterium]
MIRVTRNDSGNLILSFPYDPDRAAKIKAINGRRWHSVKKHWRVPFSQGILRPIFSIFDGQEIDLGPSLSISPTTQDTSRFQDLKRGVISRRYNPKAVKAHTFYRTS